jgi:hypothetical protein
MKSPQTPLVRCQRKLKLYFEICHVISIVHLLAVWKPCDNSALLFSSNLDFGWMYKVLPVCLASWVRGDELAEFMNDEIDDLYRPGSSIWCGAALSKVTKTHAWIFYMQRKQGVCHTLALPFCIKKYLKSKEELWKFKYITRQK